MCDSRCRVCERGHLGDWTCDPRYMVWEGNHTGECGHVTSGTGSGRRGHPKGSEPMCVPRYRVKEGVSLETADI